MSTRRFWVPACALLFLGAFWLLQVRQGERVAALEREVAGLREEVRAAMVRVSPPPAQAGVTCAPSGPVPWVPPEAFAARVAELLAERLKAQEARPLETAVPKPPPPLPPEKQPALAKAQHLVDTVLAAGVLRPEEVAELRNALLELGPSNEAHALRQRLIVATNRGELKLPPGVLPFLL